MKQSWSAQDILRVRAESLVDQRTIDRFLIGRPVRKHSAERIASAAKKLGLKIPRSNGR